MVQHLYFGDILKDLVVDHAVHVCKRVNWLQGIVGIKYLGRRHWGKTRHLHLSLLVHPHHWRLLGRVGLGSVLRESLGSSSHPWILHIECHWIHLISGHSLIPREVGGHLVSEVTGRATRVISIGLEASLSLRVGSLVGVIHSLREYHRNNHGVP